MTVKPLRQKKERWITSVDRIALRCKEIFSYHNDTSFLNRDSSTTEVFFKQTTLHTLLPLSTRVLLFTEPARVSWVTHWDSTLVMSYINVPAALATSCEILRQTKGRTKSVTSEWSPSNFQGSGVWMVMADNQLYESVAPTRLVFFSRRGTPWRWRCTSFKYTV